MPPIEPPKYLAWFVGLVIGGLVVFGFEARAPGVWFALLGAAGVIASVIIATIDRSVR